MFIIIPAVLIGLSLVGISVIVARKMSYLRKLAPEAHELGPTIWHDLFPEVIGGVKRVEAREYGTAWLRELEKFLRKMRLMFSQVDRLSGALIRRVRKAHQKSDMLPPAEPAAPVVEVTPVEPKVATPEELKAEEQRLIVEIAQDPKNLDLYVELGAVYMAMQNFADAKESYSAALALRPDDSSLQRKLAQVLKKLPSA